MIDGDTVALPYLFHFYISCYVHGIKRVTLAKQLL